MIKHQCAETNPMLSGYLDRELTQGDRQKIELILEECETCRKSLEEMKQLRQQIGGIHYKKMTLSEKDKLNREASGSVGSNLGQVLLLSGFVILYGTGAFYLLKDLILDGEAPAFVRIGVPTLFLGIGVLFFTVLYQRFQAAKTDRYKNVRL